MERRSPDDVRRAFVKAVVQLGGDAEVATARAAELVGRYAEPHRSYHTSTHVAAVLRDADDLAVGLGLDDTARAVVALAACAHDVVYDARPGDDERASAEWAGLALVEAGVDGAAVARVEQLVLFTLTHRCAPDDHAGVALLDADLAVLGSSPADYATYVRGVRAEYAAVPDDAWRTGRSAVLRGLLDRDRLYLSEVGHDRWETAARANVTAELAELDSR